MRSNGDYSLDDVLKYHLVEWKNYETPYTYDDMITYINSIIDEGIDDWWQLYVVDNADLVIKKYE